MDVGVNGKAMWLCEVCGWLWPHQDDLYPERCALCQDDKWDWPREDALNCPPLNQYSRRNGGLRQDASQARR
jgi:hypothetical protein